MFNFALACLICDPLSHRLFVTSRMETFSLKDIVVSIYQFAIIALLIVGPIVGIYFFGKRFSKKYIAAKWYFWTTFIFATPIIAAPLVFFVSLFMDKVKHDNLVPIAWLLINTYALWFILGFVGSMKLYGKAPSYISILPSIFSWIFAAAAVFGGIELVNY